MISIVTASYNYEEFIGETISSVLNQTYQNWEMIIIDDCSNDGSVDIIKSFQDERIKLFTNPRNLGLAKTVQKGIEKATGDWIVFLESDDILKPDYLEKKVKIINKNPDVNLIFNDCEFFGDEKKTYDFNIVLKKTRHILSEKHYPANLFYNFFQSNKIFTFSNVAVKKSDLLKVDYEPKMDYLLDWHLWIQLAYLGKFYYIDEQLTKWRLHNNSYINVSIYKTPFDLQIPAYLKVFKKTLDIKILLYIPLALGVWYLRELKKFLRQKSVPNKR